ncbi:muscle M-line assembly protein isoform X2 [Tasmannia lanceolata]|uniref:muscle M-line assembly protein isoform X2 n=1 Tax=Tasmannia lanceolata TaxID=3420 RepID=UPI00406421B4
MPSLDIATSQPAFQNHLGASRVQPLFRGNLSNSSSEDSIEPDEREKLRRMKISKANKGNVPWNKGRKHSAETLRRIRERTKLAMQDPKVKMKLMNLGHAQSQETRLKIGVGVRMGWQRRRGRLMVQESCCLEWKNLIAEASRKGYVGEDELQWDSYKILDKQLEEEWVESIEKRKSMPRPKGSKRAPKSPEQRRKISEAISAKWADPGYRDRVCSALAKYHGTPAGAQRKPRRKPTGEIRPVNGSPPRKRFSECNNTDGTDCKKLVKAGLKQKRSAIPSYKDPLASSKLEMIKKIRAQRASMETRKREATERAKLLIAEAEKAAEALEVAAMKSPLARASLLETRKLIAEATRSIQGIENGQFDTRSSSTRLDSNGLEKHFNEEGLDTINAYQIPDKRQVNGTHLLSSSNSNYEDFDFKKFALHNLFNSKEEDSLPVSQSAERISGEEIHSYALPDLQVGHSEEAVSLVVDPSQLKLAPEYKEMPRKGEKDSSIPLVGKTESSSAATATKKKWVCGRLVDVEGD